MLPGAVPEGKSFVNFALYRELLAVRPIRRLLLVGMVARIPHSAAGVLLTLHIVLTLGRATPRPEPPLP